MNEEDFMEMDINVYALEMYEKVLSGWTAMYTSPEQVFEKTGHLLHSLYKYTLSLLHSKNLTGGTCFPYMKRNN